MKKSERGMSSASSDLACHMSARYETFKPHLLCHLSPSPKSFHISQPGKIIANLLDYPKRKPCSKNSTQMLRCGS